VIAPYHEDWSTKECVEYTVAFIARYGPPRELIACLAHFSIPTCFPYPTSAYRGCKRRRCRGPRAPAVLLECAVVKAGNPVTTITLLIWNGHVLP
jgi:hypothetical protein